MDEMLRRRLTVEMLAELVPPVPLWAEKIRDAKAVEVRATEFVQPGKGYVLDPNHSVFRLSTTLPLMVICHPQDEQLMREVAALLRWEPPTPNEYGYPMREQTNEQI